jgi:predicted N-acetyltransferase YhbS
MDIILRQETKEDQKVVSEIIEQAFKDEEHSDND